MSCICEIYCLAQDGFDLNTVHKLSSNEKNYLWSWESNPELGIKPMVAGWEAWMLPLCYGAPPWFLMSWQSIFLLSLLIIIDDIVKVIKFHSHSFIQVFVTGGEAKDERFSSAERFSKDSEWRSEPVQLPVRISRHCSAYIESGICTFSRWNNSELLSRKLSVYYLFKGSLKPSEVRLLASRELSSL